MVVVRDVTEGKISDKSQQTGFRERLLCGECELQFSKYETYAAKNFFNKTVPPMRTSNDLVIVFQNIEYHRFKLFLLSLLWRVGIAKDDFFKCVKLGPHEEKLRLMLLAEDPGEPDEYGCMISSFIPETHIETKHFMGQPITTKNDGHHGCLLAFRGFAFRFCISRHALIPALKRSFLKKNNEIRIVRMRVGMFKPLRVGWNRSMRAIQREKLSELGAL